MEVIFDVTGYELSNGEFIVKEFCAIYVTSEIFTKEFGDYKYFIFEPPSDTFDERLATESMDFRGFKHGIPWDTRTTPYDLHKTIIQNLIHNVRTIYVHGAWKEQWLNRMMLALCPPIINIDNMRFYSHHAVDSYQVYRCEKRHHHAFTETYACAFETAQRFRQWLVEFWGVGSSYQKSIEIFYNLEHLDKMHSKDIACLDAKFLLKVAPNDIKNIWGKLPAHL